METRLIINKETNVFRKEWVLATWYEKICFVVGVIVTVIWTLAFIVGLLSGAFS